MFSGQFCVRLFVRAAVSVALFFILFYPDVKSQKINKDSLEVVARSGNQAEKLRACMKLGQLLRNENFSAALDWDTRALSLATELGDRKAGAEANLEMARILNMLGRNELAMEHAISALEEFNRVKDTLQASTVYSVMGGIYGSLNNYELALDNYEESEKLNRQKKNARGILIARHNQCTALTKLHRSEEATRIYLENLAALDTLGDPAILAATTNNLGNIYKDAGKYDLAIDYLMRSYEIKKSIRNTYDLINSCNNLGETWMKKGDLVKAARFLEEAKAYCKITGSLEREVENLRLWSQLKEKQGDYKSAYAFLEKANALADSLESKNNAEKVAQLELAYKTEKNQAEIDFLNRQKKTEEEYYRREKQVSDNYLMRQKIFIILLAAGLLGVILLLVKQFSNSGRIKQQQDEIMRANSELKVKNELLEEINREKDGLISIVAHDLRAPLNRTAALAQLITTSGDLNPEQLKYAGMVMKVAEDGTLLIQDLLEISSYQQENLRTELRPVPINEFLDGLLRAYAPLAETKLQKLIFHPGPDFQFDTDHQLLSRVIDNLISNAIKFSPRGKNIYIAQAKKENNLVISVKDEGPGLSKEDQKKLFRKFQRLSSRPTGGESSTGLGLAIVKILVEKLQGKIEVESEPGYGCTFKVVLPLQLKNS